MEQDEIIRIGKKIRETMNSFKMSVKELSARTGIEQQTLYSILNGHHQASVKKLALICKELQLSLDSLLDLEVNTFPIYSNPHEAPLNYANFEDIWFGPVGGERISVSRNFSVANQSAELRKEFLENIYNLSGTELSEALTAFEKRLEVIAHREKKRLEIVVYSEVVDFINRREPFNKLSADLVYQTIEKIIERLESDVENFEVIVIPRQHFLVNYEIINKEVILFDLGSVFFRQTHETILEHFLSEVELFRTKLSKISDRDKVIDFLKEQLYAAKRK